MSRGGGAIGGGEPDLIVVGAGAAGLAASKTARSLGLTVTVLEAKRRIGGRAHTDAETVGVPWDCGAHWLHDAERNPFTRIADALGFAYHRLPAPVRLRRAADGGGWADAFLEAEVQDYYARAFAAVERAGESGLDVAAAEVIPPHPRLRAMFDSWFAALGGAEPERTSTLDHARYRNDGANWRVEAGYGALVARWGADVPVELGTAVGRIRWGGREGVVVEAPRGTVRARAAIVTASTNVLAAGRIAFDPPLPAATRDALAAVPVGAANKVALAFDRDVFDWPEGGYLRFEHRTLEAIRFEVRPFGRDLAIGYLGGRFAAELEAAGERAMIAFALERLAEAFGAGIRRRLTGAAATGWCGDPDIGGGYSVALPGRAHLRPVLAEPIGERLFLAGEACSLTAYGTVHGAYESGVAAAQAAARVALGGPPEVSGPAGATG
ncbi:MAG TPA: NAD(P)/FAD-dependent oxidoreductase, partial [Geminicoccaceae bacterium]|nr:NAD(P)/FAD-dependent oxidoreductase [Geminicoccaceae bacterium]